MTIQYQVQKTANSNNSLSTALRSRPERSRTSAMVWINALLVIAIVVIVQVSMQQGTEPDVATSATPAPAATPEGQRLAPNGMPLPPPTRREQIEVPVEELQRSLPADEDDLEEVKIGEVSWSENDPRVRINHFWHRIGDSVKGTEADYTVVQIRREVIFVRNNRTRVVRRYAPGRLYGMNQRLVDEYRHQMRERIPASDRN